MLGVRQGVVRCGTGGLSRAKLSKTMAKGLVSILVQWRALRESPRRNRGQTSLL